MTTDRVEAIRQKLEAALHPTSMEIIDESAKHAGHAGAQSGGGHYILKIESTEFTGKSMLEQHRLIYESLGDMMQSEIHALSIQSRTPD